MKCFQENEITTKNNFIHIYSGIQKEDLIMKVEQLFLSRGYKLTEENNGKTTFVKGNRTMRILFGAFIKYFKFNVIINSESQDEIKVEVTKETSGMSGGLIGVNQVKGELTSLSSLMQSI